MWKILIADDEPKIQRGLRGQIERMALDAEVVGVADDGELALEMARTLRPDVMLVDICMPFLDGLAMAEKLRALDIDVQIILVTGYEAFDYAKRALALGVSDYLLKPVEAEELRRALSAAFDRLEQKRDRARHYQWAVAQLEKRRDALREMFLHELAGGGMDDSDLLEAANYLDFDPDAPRTLMLIRMDVSAPGDRPMNAVIARYALEGAAADALALCKDACVFTDDLGNILLLCEADAESDAEILRRVRAAAEKTFGERARLLSARVDHVADMPAVYARMTDAAVDAAPSGQRDAAEAARAYVDQHFADCDLGLDEVAAHIGVSPAYLSRLMKQSLGMGFSQYLSATRVQTAARYMRERPELLLRDVAASVGYASPFYFSTAFKRALGVSPAEYRKLPTSV